MPIFEYTCKACNAAFEQLIRSANEERSVRCPECGTERIERKFSAFATHATPASKPLPRGGGGCGRCGDPNGPCSTG